MKLHPVIPRALAALVVAASLFPASGVRAQCQETSHQWQRVELNLGSMAAPIVENAGHLADDVAFAASGATGTGARFHANGRVDLVISLETDFARVGFEPVDAGGPITLAPTEPIWGTVVYLAADGPGQLPGWQALQSQGLWGDAVVEHRVTGRTWRMTVAGDATDLGRVALRPEGIGEITADERSGNLELALAADPDRRLTLHPAKAIVDGETQYLPFVAGDDGSLRLDGEVPAGAVLETTLVMAPYYHDADAVADGRGGYLALGETADAIESGGGSGRDLVVVRTGADGRKLLGMTILASGGDDRAAGIASRFGDAYVAGAAGAAGLPIPGKGGKSAWPAPFAVRLDAEGGLSAGRYLRSDGLAAARDLAVDAEGRVLVSGEAAEGAKDSGALSLQAVTPADPDAPATTYAVAVFDADLKAAEAFQTFAGAATELPLEVRIGCQGEIAVGPELTATLVCPQLFPTWTPRSYPNPSVVPAGTAWLDFHASIQQPSFPYASWGFHAFTWKDYTQNITYDANAAAAAIGPAVPVGHVAFLDAARLNALELDTAIFPGGTYGIWEPNLATATVARRGLEAAIGAAAYAAFWGSPTYMNLSLDFPWTDGVGVMEVSFCSLNDPNGAGGLGPIEICQNQLPSGQPIDVFDASCVDTVPVVSDTSQIFLDEVRLHQWYDPAPNTILVDEVEMPGHELMTRFEQASPGGVYIGDPPEEARFSAGHVAEAVDRQMAFMVEDVPVEITTFEGGEPVSIEPGIGLVRAVDRATGHSP